MIKNILYIVFMTIVGTTLLFMLFGIWNNYDKSKNYYEGMDCEVDYQGYDLVEECN